MQGVWSDGPVDRSCRDRPGESRRQRAEKGRNGAEERREQHDRRVGDAPARVLPHPGDRRQPEEDDDGEDHRLDGRPRAGVEEIVDSGEDARGQRKNLPISQPAANAIPT